VNRWRTAAGPLTIALLTSLAFGQNGAVVRRAVNPNPQPVSAEFLQAFERGLSALERGEARIAQSLFAQLREREPNHSWTRVALAVCSLQQRDFSAAAHSLEELTAGTAAPPVAYAALGAALLNQGKVAEAVAQLELAARRSPSANPRFMLASALCLAGQPERAAVECEVAARLQPNGPTGSLPDEVRGLSWLLRGDHQRAIECFKRVLAEPLSAGRTTLPEASAITRQVEQAAIARSDETGRGGVQRAENTSAIARADPSMGLAILRIEAANAAEPAKPKPLRGIVPIVLTFPESERVRLVTFLVDGKPRGRASLEPFRWMWDTTQDADGPHKLVVQVHGDANELLLTNVRSVEIHNAAEAPPPASEPVPPTEVTRQLDPGATSNATSFEDTLGPRFERLVEFQTDVLRVRYLLAQAYEGSGKAEFAAEELAAIFLEQPSYLDARKRFLALRAQLQPTYRAGALPEVRSVNRTDKIVGLTFDDGPRPPYTQRILETLRQRKLRATFFLVGKMVETYPQFARDIIADGHELANHSFNHDNMEKLSVLECEQEVLRCERAIFHATGQRVNTFRPPGGRYGPELKQALGNLGYSTIFWTSNITSWAERPPNEIAQKMADRVQSGGIILLHNGQDQTVFVLPKLLDILQARGFRCVPMGQLLTRS